MKNKNKFWKTSNIKMFNQQKWCKSNKKSPEIENSSQAEEVTNREIRKCFYTHTGSLIY